MPEILKTPDYHQTPEPIVAPELQAQSPDAGAIDFDYIRARTKEVGSGALEFGKIAYHGIRAAISEKRTGWADDRVDKMDHKDDLYEQGRASAIDGTPTPATQERPQTLPERILDSRLEKKIHNRDIRNAKRKRIVANFEPTPQYTLSELSEQRSRVDLSLAKGEITRDEWLTKREEINRGPGYRPADLRSRTLGRKTSKDSRARRREAHKDYKNGRISAAEKRTADEQIAATPNRFENKREKRTRKAARFAQEQVVWAANQPVLGRWRGWRRKEATKDGYRHFERAEKHSAIHEELSQQRDDRLAEIARRKKN